MSLDQLWAGWRQGYVSSATDAERAAKPGSAAPDGAGPDEAVASDGCVFCRIERSGAPTVDNGVIWRGPDTYVVLNAFPYASGHLLVIPRRHICELSDLSLSESSELWEATLQSVATVQAAYSPDGVNVGANLGRAAGAGIPGHLHLHVIPRWSGDTNFMTSVAGVRVMPESLTSSWERLAGCWPPA